MIDLCLTTTDGEDDLQRIHVAPCVGREMSHVFMPFVIAEKRERFGNISSHLSINRNFSPFDYKNGSTGICRTEGYRLYRECGMPVLQLFAGTCGNGDAQL